VSVGFFQGNRVIGGTGSPATVSLREEAAASLRSSSWHIPFCRSHPVCGQVLELPRACRNDQADACRNVYFQRPCTNPATGHGTDRGQAELPGCRNLLRPHSNKEHSSKERDDFDPKCKKCASGLLSAGSSEDRGGQSAEEIGGDSGSGAVEHGLARKQKVGNESDSVVGSSASREYQGGGRAGG